MKKVLISLMCIIMVVCFMPTVAMAAEGTGTIEEITAVGSVNGDSITVEGASLDWFAKNEEIGRYKDGWWVGVKIIAPASVTDSNVDKVKFSNDGSDPEDSFADSKDDMTADGRYYMGCWLPIQPEYLEGALSHNSVLRWTYKFDWNGDKSVDQTFTINVDPANITLNKDGKVWCQTVNGKFVTRAGAPADGTIEEITAVGSVNGDSITVEGASLDWFAKNEEIGRYKDGWWVGVKIIAPASVTDSNVDKVKFSNDGSDPKDSFADSKDDMTADGRYYMNCWLPILPEYLEGALSHNSVLRWTYKFDWTGDRSVDQTFTINVDPANITLKKESNIWCQTKYGVMIIEEGKKHTDHSFGEWTILKEASYTETGSKERTCPCGEKETVEIPRLTLPYIPTTPTTPTDNVTNSGSTAADNASTSADLSGSTSTSNGTTTATVDKTTADKIVDKAVENKSTEVVIDATANTTTAANSTTVAQVTIPTETLGAIAEKTEADVTIKTDVAEVKMDNAAAAAVSEQAEGDTVQIIAEKVAEDAEKVEFELKVVCSEGKVISDFNGGNIAVTVALPKAMAEKKVVCVYIDDNGHMSKVEGQKNADGTYTFVTGHFSTYAILSEEEADAAIAAQNEAIKNIKIKLTSKQVKTKSGKKGIKIIWTAAAGDKTLDGVEVFRSKERNKGYGTEPFYTSTKGGNEGSYINTKSLKKGTKYYYRVRGYVLVDGQKVYTDYSTKAWRTFK